MQVTIEGKTPGDPRQRVLCIEAATQAMCEDIGEDAAEGAMMLLTAAAHIFMKHAKPGTDIADGMSTALANAIIAAQDWFKPKSAA